MCWVLHAHFPCIFLSRLCPCTEKSTAVGRQACLALIPTPAWPAPRRRPGVLACLAMHPGARRVPVRAAPARRGACCQCRPSRGSLWRRPAQRGGRLRADSFSPSSAWAGRARAGRRPHRPAASTSDALGDQQQTAGFTLSTRHSRMAEVCRPHACWHVWRLRPPFLALCMVCLPSDARCCALEGVPRSTA